MQRWNYSMNYWWARGLGFLTSNSFTLWQMTYRAVWPCTGTSTEADGTVDTGELDSKKSYLPWVLADCLNIINIISFVSTLYFVFIHHSLRMWEEGRKIGSCFGGDPAKSSQNTWTKILIERQNYNYGQWNLMKLRVSFLSLINSYIFKL